MGCELKCVSVCAFETVEIDPSVRGVFRKSQHAMTIAADTLDVWVTLCNFDHGLLCFFVFAANFFHV